MAITTYPGVRPIGFPGMLADMRLREGVHKFNGEASALIAPGLLVVQKSTDPLAAVLPSAGNLNAVGVVIKRNLEPNSSGVVGFAAGDQMSIMRSGTIYVVSETAVTAAMVMVPGVVRTRVAAGTGTIIGGFRSTADASTAAVITGAKFLNTCLAGGIVAIEFDFTSATLAVG